MGEPEGLLIEGAQFAAVSVRDLWWRMRPPIDPAVLALEQVRQRLEMLLSALYDVTVAIFPADPDPAPTWLARLLGRAPRHLALTEASAGTDGRYVWLPRVLDAPDGAAAALDRYRLLAVEQGARIAQRVARMHPHNAARVERDLYWIASAAIVDRGIARNLPGLARGLREARAAALGARPLLEPLTPCERDVESIVRDALSADPASSVPTLDGIDTPEDARAWARGHVQRLPTAGLYRGVAPVPLWGEPRRSPPASGAREDETSSDAAPHRARTAILRRRPRVRPARDDEPDARPGMWMVRFDDPMESAEDPMGLERPADQGEATKAAELADALAELPEARIVRTPGSAREVLQGDAPPLTRPISDWRARTGAVGIAYPEWDHRPAVYRFPGAIVRPIPAPLGSAEWGQHIRARHATLVRQVRRRFDGLRPRRVCVGRQPDGTEVDLGAFVTAFADWRAGTSSDDRLYAASRPARRDLAVAVLADVSASTDAWVSGSLRIVDVEKEALVILLEALDALGDRHAVLAFSGEGPRAVNVVTVKDFDEGSRAAAWRGIAALEPDGYTRVGAAIRHASALLSRERARFRLLLLLSDGKPNDVDEYAGRYGIEDTRRAVVEACLQGLLPFCLTVDREAPAYLPAIFGARGFSVLSRPSLLPAVLVEVFRSLVTS